MPNYNKEAFDEVLGDPFALPEKDGWYNTFKRRGAIGSQRYNFDEGHATATPGRPSTVDFFVDVEQIVKRVLVDKDLITKVVDTYVFAETDVSKLLTLDERKDVEQRLGEAFRENGIAPVSQYFSITRKGSVQ